MKVAMTENGMLVIEPESSVDAFALRKWIEEHPLLTCCCDRKNGTGVIINANWPLGELSVKATA